MKLGLDRKLGIDRFLTSWRSAEDPGFGDFSLRINPNGSPQFFFYNCKKPISRSPPWPWRNQLSLYTSTFVNGSRTDLLMSNFDHLRGRTGSSFLRELEEQPGLDLLLREVARQAKQDCRDVNYKISFG
ncbi:hypothetical protein NC651_026359 [Populus alba x Populus x berolinensis]|nr:hypothetical protein NC651_026359 [Populus alba x Populus x berolinensis]